MSQSRLATKKIKKPSRKKVFRKLNMTGKQAMGIAGPDEVAALETRGGAIVCALPLERINRA